MSGPGQPLTYKMANPRDFARYEGRSMNILGRWNGNPTDRLAQVGPTDTASYVRIDDEDGGTSEGPDHFFHLFCNQGEQGLSGGAVVSQEGEFMGILCAGEERNVLALKLDHILGAITMYAAGLRREGFTVENGF